MAAPRDAAGRRRLRVTMLAISLLVSPPGLPAEARAQGATFRVRVPRWPCRLIVKPTLLGVIEDGWERSPTLRRQCEVLAEAGAVVVLEWGPMADSQSRARASMDRRDGRAVARIVVPPVPDAVELVAHELQHVIELASGLDFEAEAERPGSGVWRAFAGFETSAAIEAGRQVARELRASADDTRRGARTR